MNRYLSVGQRVTLSKDTEWDVGDDNPTGVSGIVEGLSMIGWVCVSWCNGEKNSYRPEDSDLIPVGGE